MGRPLPQQAEQLFFSPMGGGEFMSESDDDTIRNLRGPDDPLVGALRQYRHNVGDGFVAAYDKAETEHYVAVLRATIAELESERDDLQADLYEATNDQ